MGMEQQSVKAQAVECERPLEEGIDPFYLYLDLVNSLGQGHVFLLDAAKDNAAPQYQKSILGVGPVLEVMVKDFDVTVSLIAGLADDVSRHMTASDLPWTPVETTCLDSHQSVVDGVVLRYRAADPMALLEHLRVSLKSLVMGDAQDPFSSGLLGYIGYDAVHYLEDLPRSTQDDRGLPDIRLQWYSSIIHLTGLKVDVFHMTHRLATVLEDDGVGELKRQESVIQEALSKRVEAPNRLPVLLEQAAQNPLNQRDFNSSSSVDGQSSDWEVYAEDVSEERYVDNVRRAIEYIRAGDIFQVVLSKRVRVRKQLHHYVAYDRLRHINPSPYMFMAEYPDMRLFGTSPEVQFRAVHRKAEMRPIAGTSKGRGRTSKEDEQLVHKLLSDEKEQAEHVMLVDLCRNDLGRVCKTGTVRVPEYLVAERYSHVIHIVSSVIGELRDDVSVFHALLATFPAGTLSGAPKIRAMEIIDELEQVRRGPYGGMVGMIDFNANANTAIIIRSVVESGDEYFIQAGAGIVADSDPLQEWAECGRKSGALLDVLLN